MGYRFGCRCCPKRYKTSTGRKAHEEKSCIKGRTLAGANCRVDAQASEQKNGEGSAEEMIINGDNGEETPQQAGRGKRTRKFEGLTSPAPRHPFGQESLSLEILTGIFAQPFCKGRLNKTWCTLFRWTDSNIRRIVGRRT